MTNNVIVHNEVDLYSFYRPIGFISWCGDMTIHIKRMLKKKIILSDLEKV